MSRAPEVDEILKLIEANDDVPGIVRNLALHFKESAKRRLTSLASDFLGFLTLNRQGLARLHFDNSILQEGFELWQKVVKHIRSPNEIRRHELILQVQRLSTAGKLVDVPMALLRWGNTVQEYIEAGGGHPSYEERKGALLNI